MKTWDRTGEFLIARIIRMKETRLLDLLLLHYDASATAAKAKQAPIVD